MDDQGSTIGEGTRCDGKFGGQDLVVHGELEGEIQLTGTLRLGPKARVKAKVKAARVEIEGRFEGEVRSDALVFGPGAQARGNFLSARLVIQDGARVEGAVNRPEPTAAKPQETTSVPVPEPDEGA